MTAEKEKIWNDRNAFKERVRLPAAQAAAVSPEELDFVLAYELEPVAKIPAAVAEVAWMEIPDPDPSVRVFDVRIRRKGTAAVEKRGGFAVKAAIFAGFAVLAAVVVDFAAVSSGLSSVQKDFAVRSALDAAIKEIENETNRTRNAAETVRREREEARAADCKVAAMRSAYSGAMGLVASVCVGEGKSFVREFSSPGPFVLEIKAVSENAESSSTAVSALSRAAAEKGWKVVPGEISRHGAISSFTCTIDMGVDK